MIKKLNKRKKRKNVVNFFFIFNFFLKFSYIDKKNKDIFFNFFFILKY